MKRKNQFIYATIPNWKKYNPRPDRKSSYSWFRMNNNFFDDPSVFLLNLSEKCTFIHLLCLMSDQNTDVFCINIIVVCSKLGISPQNMLKILQRLQDVKLLTFTKMASHVRTDVTNTHVINDVEIETDKTANEKTKKPKGTGTDSQARPDDTQAVVAYYCDLFKTAYGKTALVGGKEAGILKRLVKNHGSKRVLELLTVYFEMTDTWFTNKNHDLGTFATNLNKIVAYNPVQHNSRKLSEQEAWDLLNTPPSPHHESTFKASNSPVDPS